MENLTFETFKTKVFDIENNKDFKFLGKKPAIIDFYADWCNPCKTIAPILEELDAEFQNIDIYKINTEEQNDLAAVFGIRSIPSLLFIPLEGQPQMVTGALPKDIFIKAIDEIFYGKKEEESEITDAVEVPEEEKEDDTIEIIGDDLIVTAPVDGTDETETIKVPLKEEKTEE